MKACSSASSTRPRNAALPAGCLLVMLPMLCLVESAQAFEVFRHVNMTSEVLTRQGVGGSSLSFIEHGASWPDIWGCRRHCYCPGWINWACTNPDDETVLNVLSPQHFDNNRLAESANYVNMRMSIARSTLLDLHNPLADAGERLLYKLALGWFGNALHVVQDFYAHSTYLECNRQQIRLSGNVAGVALWQGETWEGCDAAVGSVVVDDLQTGFVDVATPPGSVSHDALNKDSPSSDEGKKELRRVSNNQLIATYYEAVSGQFGGTTNPYTDLGLAPRHTMVAWQALVNGGPVFSGYPILPQFAPRLSRAEEAAWILDLIAAANNDPILQADAALIDSLDALGDPADPTSYPFDRFDENGLPLPDPTWAEEAQHMKLLEPNIPNPVSRSSTAIVFASPTKSHASLRIFNVLGQEVRQLYSGTVEAGRHRLNWDGCDEMGNTVNSGLYYYRIEIGGKSETRALTWIR